MSLVLPCHVSSRSRLDMIYASMSAGYWLKMIAPLLICALAFSQTDQPTNTQLPTPPHPVGIPAKAQKLTRPPARPPSVAEAARSSKRLRESAPPAKIYRNKDVREHADARQTTADSPGDATASQAGLTPVTSRSAATAASGNPLQSPAAFASQGITLRNQVRVQKGKIIDIRNEITRLKAQFAEWSAGFLEDQVSPVCWTTLHDSPYYLAWCDTGRSLKAQYDGSQRQLEQEKTRLRQMQEAIRRKGYGNAISDPD
jgi:hypothetical protein